MTQVDSLDVQAPSVDPPSTAEPTTAPTSPVAPSTTTTAQSPPAGLSGRIRKLSLLRRDKNASSTDQPSRRRSLQFSRLSRRMSSSTTRSYQAPVAPMGTMPITGEASHYAAPMSAANPMYLSAKGLAAKHIEVRGNLPARAEGGAPMDLGSQILIFSPTQNMTDIQNRLDDVYKGQVSSEFGHNRWAIYFMPGEYKLDVKVGYYMTVCGMGNLPEDTVITGSVRSKADWMEDHNATLNFWRGVENLKVIPDLMEDSKAMVWATSQGTWLRRIHVQGPLALSDHGGYASGGFVADSIVDDNIMNGTQQQYLVRNTSMYAFQEGMIASYAQVFVGDQGAPAEDWPAKPFSNIQKTPLIREKPFLSLGENGVFQVSCPPLLSKCSGPSWVDGKGNPDAGANAPKKHDLSTFYIAHPGKDNAMSINDALARGQSVFFTPGIYKLEYPLRVFHRGTILLGTGLATLRPMEGTPAVVVADVDGVHLAGLLLEGGPHLSSCLLKLGEDGPSGLRHNEDPVVLSDVMCRVGGAAMGRVSRMLEVNVCDAILDQTWLWRADHGNGVGWYTNQCANGLVVNADDVTAYGLFVEHNQEFQTIWNGENGAVFLYQSEFPYDPPSNVVWSHVPPAIAPPSSDPHVQSQLQSQSKSKSPSSSNSRQDLLQPGDFPGIRRGFPSYKVGPRVKSHFATGLGVYCVFVSPASPLDVPPNSGASSGSGQSAKPTPTPIRSYTAVEQPLVSTPNWFGPDTREVLVRHVYVVRFGGEDGTGAEHVINDKGGSALGEDGKRLAFLEDAYGDEK